MRKHLTTVIMKKVLVVICLTSLLVACGKKEEAKKEAVATPEAKVSSTAGESYMCPMKCEGEKTYTQAGKCPSCKMDLAKIDVASDTKGNK